MKRYTAKAEYDDGWWSVSIAELPGVFTQARRLAQVEELARDAIALAIAGGMAPKERFVVDVEPSFGALDAKIADARAARLEAQRLQQRSNETSVYVAKRLARRGLSVRDIGQVLGISHQRVHQLVHADDPVKA